MRCSDVPETTVKLGSSLDPSTIREGTDVYFDCLVTAHPHVYKVEWRHNVNMEFSKNIFHQIFEQICTFCVLRIFCFCFWLHLCSYCSAYHLHFHLNNMIDCHLAKLRVCTRETEAFCLIYNFSDYFQSFHSFVLF